ncbi:DUF2218 domain-containing protein [Spirilliplanes yamanashiensis]|uniref:DUF2218 domain-containing protein n=1 Tax=Spirilliplanes yamanashiensis TaxID=42233 RepID=A0A8J3YC55_9ACTN|nr:DUF2218 domain-containing protein [Spirilliplanes yamanashiensis]MDP9818727.1 hypothetical protein [Spirilliplanes yamanashiensis]GIJ05182.1 hypothetical protein Sya03_45340 [Spirilliplanes yamanashiensis]
MNTTAYIATDRPARYLKQLVSHVGRKIPVEEADGGATFRLSDTAVGAAVVDGDGLRCTATAADAETLARVQHVVGGHLIRFMGRDEPVAWTDASQAS